MSSVEQDRSKLQQQLLKLVILFQRNGSLNVEIHRVYAWQLFPFAISSTSNDKSIVQDRKYQIETVANIIK